MNAAHTPTPWLLDGKTTVYAVNEQGNNRFCLNIQGGYSDKAEGILTTDAELAANAALIVRAVNCHSELVELLRDIKIWMAAEHRLTELRGRISAAIAKAEAQS